MLESHALVQACLPPLKESLIFKRFIIYANIVCIFIIQVFDQLIFAPDLIEINNGKCLKLSSRAFIKTPLKPDDLGVISPRTYCDYTLSNRSGDGGYFAHSILNSFPDVPIRVDFLNKFYQCLLFGQLEHKTKKLVVCGDNNSGKSSWAKVFFGLLNRSRIVSVTQEKKFGMAMVNENTELIFIDEWSTKTLDISNVKILFQGGWMTRPVKFKDPEQLHNQAGMYLTCNVLPDFGDEQPNVNRRIAVFHTKEIKDIKTQAPKWIENNPMECLVWVINEINRNVHLIPRQERFYEKAFDEPVTIENKYSFPQEEFERMKQVSLGAVKIDLNVESSVENDGEENEKEDDGESETESAVPKDCAPGMEWIYNLTQEGKL